MTGACFYAGTDALLLLQAADVVDQVPAVLLRQVFPGRHRAATVGDLPEQLTVGFGLDLRRRPVRGLRWLQRAGGGALTITARTVPHAAVRFPVLPSLVGAYRRL